MFDNRRSRRKKISVTAGKFSPVFRDHRSATDTTQSPDLAVVLPVTD
jgi:hypothetical protein